MAIALDKAVVIRCLEKYKSDKHGPTKANQSTPTTTIPAHPKGLGESSPDISLNHRLDDGKKRRTIGPIPKSNAKSTNGNAVAELQSASIAPIRQRLMTIVFGARNHVRLPSRSAKTMPTGSDSRQSPNSKTKRMPDKDYAFTIASINNRTDSITYIQPRVSTIVTGNGFFKSFIFHPSLRTAAHSPQHGDIIIPKQSRRNQPRIAPERSELRNSPAPKESGWVGAKHELRSNRKAPSIGANMMR